MPPACCHISRCPRAAHSSCSGTGASSACPKSSHRARPQETSPRATFLVAGTGFRTCDLWVMSQPVAVSSRLAGLKRRGHDESPDRAIARHVSPDRGSCATFRSQIRSQALAMMAPVFNRAHSARIVSDGDGSAASRAPIDGGWTWKRTGPLATSVPRTRTARTSTALSTRPTEASN
jgi:hypothetical protein